MKITIKWRYPDETKIHENTYFGIAPETIVISNGKLTFGESMLTPSEETSARQHWNFPLDHIVKMTVDEEKTIFEVGYNVGDGIFSVNMIEGTEITSEQCAMEHARNYGYELAYILPISASKAEKNKAKGMPLIKA